MDEFGMTLNKLGKSPPYNPKIPSFLHILWGTYTDEVKRIFHCD